MEPKTRTGARLWYYSYFDGHGYELLAKTLHTAEPFTLLELEIVVRVLAAGYTPNLDRASQLPFATAGAVSMVRCEGKMFIVSVDHKDETIMVQEQRTDAYEREE